MLIKEHHFNLYVYNKVHSFVVEELIWSGDRRWPHKFRVIVKLRCSLEKTFYGPTPEETVEEAIQYVRRQEVRVLSPNTSLRQLQTRSGATGD